MTPYGKYIYELNRAKIEAEKKQACIRTLYTPGNGKKPSSRSKLSASLAGMMFPAAAEFTKKHPGNH